MMKKELRSNMLKMRNSISNKEVEEKSGRIRMQLFSLPEFSMCKSIMTYVSFRNEVETRGIITECLKMGKKIMVPLTIPEEKYLLPCEIYSLCELAPGHYGILEPKDEFKRPVKMDSIDMVLVPGLAFDKNGYRIGYGGGYYDRLIKNLSPGCLVVGVAFECQIICEIPRDKYDMGVHIIITEGRVIRCTEEI